MRGWRQGRETETVRFRQTTEGTESKHNYCTLLHVVNLAWSFNRRTNPSLSHLIPFNSMQRQRFQACIRGSAFMIHGVSFILGKTGAVNQLYPLGATAQGCFSKALWAKAPNGTIGLYNHWTIYLGLRSFWETQPWLIRELTDYDSIRAVVCDLCTRGKTWEGKACE